MGEELYVEVPFPMDTCSDFVRDTVIPLLNRYSHAYCPRPDLRPRLLNWLEIVRRRGEDVEICVDFDTDRELFSHALESKVPPWCSQRRISRNIDEPLRYPCNKRTGLPEYHALHDAGANRYAFRDHPPGAA